MSTDTKTMSRRQALRRGAAAGAVVWAVPMVTSSTAHASGGSNGSKIEGRLKSVTCVWDRTNYQPNRGTQTRPKHNYSKDVFCEINVGRGWQLLARNQQFTIPAGQVLQMRPWSGHAGGRSAEAPVDGATESQIETVEEPTVEAPVAPETTAAPAPETTAAPAVPEPSDGATTVPATTVPAAPTVATTPDPAAYVDTIVIDMTGRTEISIGDVYGYFSIVDADPA